MLTIKTNKQELLNESTSMVVRINEITVKMEHSLISVSKWESKYKRAFLPTRPDQTLTHAEWQYYIRCMIIGKSSGDMETVVNVLWFYHRQEVLQYIHSRPTATSITNHGPNTGAPEVLTSDLIYFWMFKFGIHKSAEKWHLERLLILIRIFIAKDPNNKKKMSGIEYSARQESMRERNAKLLKMT